MGNVIPLHGDPHETTQRLMPWFLTDMLDPAEHALVEGHLASCAECAAELISEERLRIDLLALPGAPAGDWAALRDRALASQPRPGWWASRGLASRVGLIAAGQAAILLLGIGVYDRLRPAPQAEYHALSAPQPAAHTGNIILIFRPDSRERAMRAALDAVGARLVDGPTAAGAYVLAVPQARRDAALDLLRKRPDIVLAQPIDAAP
ncbi:anti-sigma factor family protein [Sphingobium nicotianae]|uniref:Zf-HC2 domain-containing protein n=1 Tax=Sphingobium nicotianae TaxID=2782607 RepID=A0A9X1DBP6_9SPHN|nr:zf-HC2 domain-containing protein [Sphingobium nicotianae]MBT2186738.1 zf-HC2 domain-containing protein [Sphingobium nicotianae]